MKKNFLWGASTSAYQIEGAFDTDGKGLSIQDVKIPIEGTPDFKICSDHYNKYKEDVKLLHELKLNSYRFSIAWTRIIPDGDGEVNKKGIEFYSNLIDELLKYNIEPIVTIYHFDIPYKLQEKGGWENKETIDAFLNYSKILFEKFGDRVKYWLTINEQNMMTIHSSSIDGLKEDKMIYQRNHNMFLASAKVINLCHKMLPNSKIGPAPNIALVYPNSSHPEDILASINANAIRNWLYLDMYVYGRYNKIALEYIKNKGYYLEYSDEELKILEKAKPDYLGINYYYTTTVSRDIEVKDDLENLDHPIIEKGYFRTCINPNLKFTEYKWQIDETGFENTLYEIYQRYNLPILITENGLGANDKLELDGCIHDNYRMEFLKNHLIKLKKCINLGIDIIGYSPWSAIDLISTHQGFEKRYGFVYVNRDNFDIKDLKRYKKDSFYWYKKVIESNGSEL